MSEEVEKITHAFKAQQRDDRRLIRHVTYIITVILILFTVLCGVLWQGKNEYREASARKGQRIQLLLEEQRILTARYDEVYRACVSTHGCRLENAPPPKPPPAGRGIKSLTCRKGTFIVTYTDGGTADTGARCQN